ncbi:WD repeat-containing protein 7 [Leucoagaricus sp. SymC.cos]|nr:WD repeat-containing protein 7 [Leucoagaricus sp. SymC.cos]
MDVESRNLEDNPATSTVWEVPAPLPSSPDAASTLSLKTKRFVTDAITVAKTLSTSRDQTRAILQSLDHLRTVLSALITPGLNSDVDSICKGKLAICESNVSVGLAMSESVSLFNTRDPREVWCISSNVTAARLLGIALVLRAVALFEEYTEAANTVVSFYTTSLSACIGEAYKPPSLSYLASLWFHGSTELRQAIRTVFDSTISTMSDEEAITTLEHWQHYIPCLQLPSERESLTAALSLFICGFIAAEKYSFMSAPVLRDISKSISLYLLDEKSSYRVLAIDLCSRGFTVWQHYIDSMEILRSLFMLATTSRKNDISPQNVGAQARAAVLFIATNNTALFMSTLGLDILTPPTLEHRRSVLQIVAFLIRKRPSVLHPNLPRLMEAVVKSLDPNNTTNRDAVLDTATEIIGYVVKTFPTVDFHMSSQRLAVGTHEGAVIMYDLKTAIRLFVLEGHKKAITALSFSPDGRRLVTLSMEESVALVWKVGASFMSFFTPGAPPRQGNSGGQPFKTFPFNLGHEGILSPLETLTQVKFDWTGDRSVKLKIRNSTLTFST